MINAIPQRRFVLELRFAVDDARRSGKTERLRALIAANPDAMASRHVIHNLGAGRLAWLREQGYVA